MDRLTYDFQNDYRGKNIYYPAVFSLIDPSVKIHNEACENPLSSAASCLNVLGAMAQKPEDLLVYLNSFGLKIQQLLLFPTGANVGEEIYSDTGYVIFEWIGPRKSPINETGGGRGLNRTSVDAYILAVIDGKVTQMLVEWKFTEGKSRPLAMERFSGLRGIERLRRYSQVLTGMRNSESFPFDFDDEKGIGLYDFSVDHLYQLLRMTLLAKTTTPLMLGEIKVEDYRIVHLTHSKNDEINILHEKYLSHSPGLRKFSGMDLHEAWKKMLSAYEKDKFIGGHWDDAIKDIPDVALRTYLSTRY
ncbi:MAG: hypothetical protein V1799_00505 [bacterium]